MSSLLLPVTPSISGPQSTRQALIDYRPCGEFVAERVEPWCPDLKSFSPFTPDLSMPLSRWQVPSSSTSSLAQWPLGRTVVWDLGQGPGFLFLALSLDLGKPELCSASVSPVAKWGITIACLPHRSISILYQYTKSVTW